MILLDTDILSLVPVIYAHDFERLQTAGRMSVAGRVRGSYGPTAFPGFTVLARVDGGFKIVGRVSDVINVAGKKVSPAEIEEVLLKFRGVRQDIVR